MIFEHQSPNKKILIVISGLVLVGGALCLVWLKAFDRPESISCTQEAKLCPDGSYVGRTGPNCEFSACPEDFSAGAWNTITDRETGIAFQYPEEMTAEYIRAFDWPPQIQVLDEAFACAEGGAEISRAGQTLPRTVDDRAYCVTKVTEGAAGSIYTQYAYAFPKDNKTFIFTFSLQAVQCGNYDEQRKLACEGERESFDLDSVVDRMARSIK